MLHEFLFTIYCVACPQIVVEIMRILNETELVGRLMNTKKLGERKNCNLPGVRVRLPVLMEKDIDDVQNFACHHKMDFIAASFVQTADDVRYIRKILDDAGGNTIKIISKIESAHGLKNFDEILEVTDGVMVARGDLAMEIPSWKVRTQPRATCRCLHAPKLRNFLPPVQTSKFMERLYSFNCVCRSTLC